MDGIGYTGTDTSTDTSIDTCTGADTYIYTDAVWFIGATHAKTNLSTQENSEEAQTWLPGQECYQRRHERSEVATTEGALEAHSRLVV